MTESTDGYVLWQGKFFRAVSTDRSPIDHAYNIVVQRLNDGAWQDEPGGYNSLSNDYAYTNAREDAQRRERACLKPGSSTI